MPPDDPKAGLESTVAHTSSGDRLAALEAQIADAREEVSYCGDGAEVIDAQRRLEALEAAYERTKMATKRRLHVTRANAQNGLRKQGWPEFRKVETIRARYIPGPFTVETREGVLDMPEGGWLALDRDDYPYPIAADVFQRIYEQVDG